MFPPNFVVMKELQVMATPSWGNLLIKWLYCVAGAEQSGIPRTQYANKSDMACQAPENADVD